MENRQLSTEERIARAIELGIDPEFAQVVGHVPGPITLAEADFIRHQARQVRRGVIIEVGSYRGKSTVALSIGSNEGSGAAVYAFDPHEEFQGVFGGIFGPEDRGAFYRNMLSTGAYRNVRLVNLSSEVVAPGWDKEVGLLWIDGDHRYEGVKRDFEMWRPHLVPGAVVAFDDTNRGGPERLVDELLSDNWTLVRTVGKVRAIRRTA